MGALQLGAALLQQLLQSRAALAAENLALRQQLALLQRSVKRPRLHRILGRTGGRRRAIEGACARGEMAGP